jgi:hypothetical protein
MEVEAGKFCMSFPYPAQKWQSAGCSMATHAKKAIKPEQQSPQGFQEKRRQKVNVFLDLAP